MLATASLTGGQEVTMIRQSQVALIPVFQFGVFSESDLLFQNGGNINYAGPLHTNADLYPFSAGTLTFHDKISAFGNVIRTQLPNGIAGTNYASPVYIPTASTDCAQGGGASSTCIAMAVPTSGTSPYGDGSVTTAGTATAQAAANNNSAWSAFSKTTTSGMIVNGNYGSKTNPGTGAKKLSMSFVGGTGTSFAYPYEIIRRPPAGEDTTSAVSQAREYNMAQIRVLLSDDPNDLPGGSGDANNIRLANITTTQATAQNGGTAGTATNPYGITIASTNYGSGFPAPSSGNTYNLYFAAAANVIPNSCTSSSTCTMDWPYGPAIFSGATSTSPTQGLQPVNSSPTSTGAVNAPTYETPATAALASALVTGLCPPSSPPVKAGVAVPVGCPAASTYPYFAPPNPVGATLYASPNATAWSLIDGYLRVEYKNSSGVWTPVTSEWLSLGFARGTKEVTQSGGGTPASASNYTPTPNPINPNAILIFQEPADRLTTAPATLTNSTVPAALAITGASAPSTVSTTPVCSTTQVIASVTYCTAWTGVVPALASDSGSGGQWAFGLTPATPTAQSLTQYNWYPINFYDAREGEVREQSWVTGGTTPGSTDTTCTTNGVMNAVEIDVGNLKRWLAGTIGSSGTSVDYVAQNGYVLYFSDRRGMLVSPHKASIQPTNTKTGDAGLEDVINASGSGDSATGTPDGTLEPVPTGRTFSPEDTNQNGFIDNWGAKNLGLGFYGTGNSATQNLNTLINSTANPNPYGTQTSGAGSNRIGSCGTTARKNWVSGARHVLKLVDGSLGNLPLNPNPIVSNGVTYHGGFTVASENPVYIQGDYNSNSTDTAWNSSPTDSTGMAAAAVLADTVILLSNNWDDRLSLLGSTGNTSPSHYTNKTAANTYYRLAIASGKNMTFTYPSVWATKNDMGTDGGIHNFLHLIENWSGYTTNYKGSMASLYYSTYNTGFYKCCVAVYNNGTRNFSFDADFKNPAGLPPGTPMFRDVESLGYRQVYTTRLTGQ